MGAKSIVLLVVGILVLQALIWVPVIAWLRRRSAELVSQLRAEIDSGEAIVLGPESVLYRGASAGFTKVKGNGVALLTDRRLIIAKAAGARVELPMDELVSLREDTWFLKSYRGGRPHLVATLKDGSEVGFIAARHAEWTKALGEQIRARRGA